MTDTMTRRGLILMGWDGAGWNNVKPLLDQGRLPNLASLPYRMQIEVTENTITCPGWVQIMTGLNGGQTGVFGNEPIDTKLNLDNLKKYSATRGVFVNSNYWIRPVPYNQTIGCYLKQHNIKVGWVTSKDHYLGTDPAVGPLCNMVQRADFHFAYDAESVEDPGYIDAELNAFHDFMSSVGTSKFWLFVHTNPDIYGHRYGESSARYLEEFERSDVLLGEILGHINREEVKVMITTDHGFDVGENVHYNAPDAWLVSDIRLKYKYGNLRDIFASMMRYFRIQRSITIPQCRSKSLVP